VTTDSSSGTADPYAKQTSVNTGSQEWLSGYQTIKADFGSLSQYALNMQMAAMDLQPAAMSLYQITELTNQAFRSSHPSFPEGTLAASMIGNNFKDLISMLTDLHVGLQNTAYAAQTISDAYHLNDDGSSHDLNSLIKVDGVDFAFGLGGDRPSGLAKGIGKTWLDEHGDGFNEAQANAAAVSNAADPSQMGGTVSVTYEGPSDHETKVTTVTYPDGSSIKIEESGGEFGGPSYTTTYVVGSDGKTQSSNCQVTTTKGGTTTVVTQTPDKDGVYHDVSKQTTTTTTKADGTRVTTTDTSTISKGKSTPSDTQTKTQNIDGSTETDTTSYSQDSKGHTTSTTNRQAVGDNDTDVSNQKGDNDPKTVADRDDTTFTHRVMQ
jgi:hypothetical protein